MSDDVYDIKLVDAWHTPDLHIYETVESSGLLNFRFEFARMKDSSRGLHAEITVYMEFNGQEDAAPKRIFGPVDQNLLAGSWKTNVAKQLAEGATEYDWQAILMELIPTTIDKHRDVYTVASNHTWEQDKDAHPFLLEPFIASQGVTVLFGPGGTGKSTLAVAMSMSVMSGVPIMGDFVHNEGPVLWVDYEADENEVYEREIAIRRQLKMDLPANPLHYVKVGGKFVDGVPAIRRRLHDTESVLIVIDSVANARRGDAFGPEDTVQMFSIMGHLGVPVLAIDHMSAEAAARQDFTKPYGTVFTSNEARLTWGVMKNEMASTPESVQLNMKMAKQNRFKNRAPRGIQLDYESFESGIVETLELTENAGVWEDGMTTTQRVLRVFRATPAQHFMIHEIVTDSELNLKSVEKEVKRLYDEGILERRKLSGRGGPLGYRERQVAQ